MTHGVGIIPVFDLDFRFSKIYRLNFFILTSVPRLDHLLNLYLGLSIFIVMSTPAS